MINRMRVSKVVSGLELKEEKYLFKISLTGINSCLQALILYSSDLKLIFVTQGQTSFQRILLMRSS